MNNKLNKNGAEAPNLGGNVDLAAPTCGPSAVLPNVKAQRREPEGHDEQSGTSPSVRCSAWLGSVVLGSGSSEPQNQPAQFDHTDDIFSKSALIPSNIGRIAPKYSEGANSGISKSFNVLFA